MTRNEYFFEYMRTLLGERYDAFIYAYNNKPRHKALRVNTRKISTDEFKKLFEGKLERNPLCENSFYCDVKPSLDPLYHAGLYYMQEPSASAAVASFAPYIGERVLDICAAPGGKATQIAEYMRGGVLYCNDTDNKRVRALIENIERLGIRNAVVTNATAADYRAAGYDGYFDTIIADVPCSGGGMMRYEDVPYSAEIVKGCAERQRVILRDCAELLCKNGYMLYSTCTFSKEENEGNIEFLRGLGFETVDIPLLAGVERAIGLEDGRRIYPMNFDGEGHFYCVLKKVSGCEKTMYAYEKQKRVDIKVGGLSFCADDRNGKLVLKNFNLPFFATDIKSRRDKQLRFVRVGVPIYCDDCGSHKQRELSYAFTHALDVDEVTALGSVEAGDNAYLYLSGNQLDMQAPSGSVIVTYKGYALGPGYSAASGDGCGVVKNKYPKNLRI